MGYKDNQKGKYVQKTDGPYRKITGLWRKSKKKRGKDYIFYKSGKMNYESFENMQAFGPKTEFFLLPNRRKGPNAPDYFLFSAEGYGELKKDVYWDDNNS